MSWQQKGFPAAPWSSPRTPTGGSRGSTGGCSRRRKASQGCRCSDLYSSYPDYDIDVPAEQALATQASLIVLMHPIQWYSMPALLKLWLDEVLTYGWAYGPGGTALKGKDLWLVATTGGPEAPTTPRATTAISSTPSCRPTSRPRYCAACASCRPWSCTAPVGRAKRTWPATCRSSRTACAPIRNGPNSTSSSLPGVRSAHHGQARRRR